MCRLSENPGSLNLLKPSGACLGLYLPSFTFCGPLNVLVQWALKEVCRFWRKRNCLLLSGPEPRFRCFPDRNVENVGTLCAEMSTAFPNSRVHCQCMWSALYSACTPVALYQQVAQVRKCRYRLQTYSSVTYCILALASVGTSFRLFGCIVQRQRKRCIIAVECESVQFAHSGD